MTGGYRYFDVAHQADWIVARFALHATIGRHDSLEVERDLLRALERHDAPNLRLDLDGLQFLSSSTLAVLIMLDKRLKSTGGRLVVCNVSADVGDVFRVTQLDRILDVRCANGTPDDSP